jgi:hypothetical protein
LNDYEDGKQLELLDNGAIKRYVGCMARPAEIPIAKHAARVTKYDADRFSGLSAAIRIPNHI